jgi:hypothetical protein
VGDYAARALALIRKYHADVKDVEQEHRDWSDRNEKEKFAFAAELASQGIQTIADFQKIGTDKELAKLDKAKKARLLKLDQEYKAGTISKESYEAQKSNIEVNYDEQTRQLKKRSAEKEKQLNIAQAVIAGVLAVVKASPDPIMMTVAGITAALGVAKIIATPIPEFEQGGLFGGPKPHYARGGRLNPKAGVAGVGQRHSGGGIRMVDGATGEHLGEWERGEAYMILSRDTYANNKHLVDELIDTSLYRGGAPVRRQPGYFEAGGTFAPAASAPAATSGAAASQELVQAVHRVEDAVRALGRIQAIINWNQDDTASVEEALGERAADRIQGSIR